MIAKRLRSWTRWPQALMGLVCICLCMWGYSAIARPSQQILGVSRHESVKSPETQLATPRHACQEKPCMALTFDDGPNPEVTPQILDLLARQQVKATFFLVGSRVSGQEHLVQRQHREGHEIGNHTWSHPNMTKLSPEEVRDQIDRTQQVIAAAGVPLPKVLRPPYGAVGDVFAAHNSLAIIRWNIDPEDWLYKDSSIIQQQLTDAATPGGIILLHDIYPATVAALEAALPILKQQYQFVTVSELLNLTAGDQGQYFKHP